MTSAFTTAVTRPLNIAFVVDIFDDNGVGGIQSSRRFVDGLRRHHNVTVIATGAPAKDKVCVPVQRIHGFQWIIEKNGFAFGAPNSDILREVLPGHDLVYIHFTLPLGFNALRIARELEIPVIFGNHFQAQNVLFNLRLNWRWLNRSLARFFVRHFYNRADHVICPSAMAQQELLDHGFNGSASVVSNGLPSQFTPNEMPRPPRFEGQFVILMVSRLSREKRHDLVLQAIARSRHASRIHLVATGKGPMQSHIAQMARKLGISADLGYVSDQQLLQLYNTADLMVHASEAELEGMAVLEAIGCGLPALVARGPNTAAVQFALDERFEFAAGNAEQLSERIDHWIENPEELSSARPQYVAKSAHYGFEAALQQLETLFATQAGISPRQPEFYVAGATQREEAC